MFDAAAFSLLVLATGGFIALGVRLGTMYIDQVFRLRSPDRAEQPLVRPAHPSGLRWHSIDN
jgi:hypothetical protein